MDRQMPEMILWCQPKDLFGKTKNFGAHPDPCPLWP